MLPLHESVTGLELFVAGTTLICNMPDCPTAIVNGLPGTLRLKSGMFTFTKTEFDAFA